jgi:hypothetical protein
MASRFQLNLSQLLMLYLSKAFLPRPQPSDIVRIREDLDRQPRNLDGIHVVLDFDPVWVRPVKNPTSGCFVKSIKFPETFRLNAVPSLIARQSLRKLSRQALLNSGLQCA